MKTFGPPVLIVVTCKLCGTELEHFKKAQEPKPKIRIWVDRNKDEWLLLGWCPKCKTVATIELDDTRFADLERTWLNTEGIEPNSEGEPI